MFHCEFARETQSIFPCASVASLQTELIDQQENEVLNEVNCDPVTKMLMAANDPNLQKVAIFVLTMLGSTYHCESAVSTMNLVKKSRCSSLTNEHLDQSLCVEITPFVPRFNQLFTNIQCHFSNKDTCFVEGVVEC